jgi:hypothetical protein
MFFHGVILFMSCNHKKKKRELSDAQLAKTLEMAQAQGCLKQKSMALCSDVDQSVPDRVHKKKKLLERWRKATDHDGEVQTLMLKDRGGTWGFLKERQSVRWIKAANQYTT